MRLASCNPGRTAARVALVTQSMNRSCVDRCELETRLLRSRQLCRLTRASMRETQAMLSADLHQDQRTPDTGIWTEWSNAPCRYETEKRVGHKLNSMCAAEPPIDLVDAGYRPALRRAELELARPIA